MGFFSGLFGGQSTTTPATGMYALPPEYQELYKGLLSQGKDALLPNGQLNTAAFTPIPQTGDETRAIDLARQGIAPTPESFQRDLAMLMNPYDDSVINGLNREATGQNSLVNQYASRAGQQGSNRDFLATSDVEQNRLNNIGQFRQSQYNNAVNQALGPLAGLKQQDINNLFGVGQFQRGLDFQTKQAPFNTFGSSLDILAGLANLGQGSTSQTIKTGGGLGGLLNGINSVGQGINAGMQLASFFSDERLKEDIVPRGEENGFPIYEFSYHGDKKRYIGVMAQDVQQIMPQAVGEHNGFMTVNYDMIGVRMREA